MDKDLNKCGCGEGCGCGEHDHDHDCGCASEELEHMVVDLEDEDGNIIECPIIDAFEFEENEYVLAQHGDEDTVYLFRATEDGELIVPEEEEFEKVSNYYSEELCD